MNFDAVILAGGRSSRMGRDKAWLETGGETLLARQIRCARQTGATQIFTSGRPGVDYSMFGCLVLEDRFPNAGPLAGIERGLAAATLPLLLVLAVDLPNMAPVFLQRLAANCSETIGVIPAFSGRLEPLAAFYPKAAQSLAVTHLERGCFAAKDFAASCVQQGFARVAGLREDEAQRFVNWNSPADLPCLA